MCEEWKERHPNMVDDVSSKFLQLRFISLELRQQGDLYDCGLFLQAPSVDCHGKSLVSSVSDVIESRGEAGPSGASCYPIMWDGNPSNGSTKTDIQFPIVSPVRAASWVREPEIIFKDLQLPVVSPYFDCQQMSVSHQRGFMSPIEETEVFGDENAISIVRTNS